ncbi:hypothetical protein ACS0TY_027524 [Phlomoides rotata]
MAAAKGACLNHISRETSDIKRLAKFYIEDKGIHVHETSQSDGKIKQAFFFDPDGNGLEVTTNAPAL